MGTKITTREHILSCAQTAFLQKGLLSVVMDDIAQLAELSRRTLYRYFKTKEEIAFEVCTDFLVNWNTLQRGVYDDLQGNGIEKLQSFLIALVDAMSAQGDVMSYIGEFDYYFVDKQDVKLPDELLGRYENASKFSDQLILSLLNEGVADGTIELIDSVERIEVTISNLYGPLVNVLLSVNKR